jgi:hypothetical protein
MKRNIGDLEARQAKGLTNRPELVDKRPQGVLFSTAGQTGWRRRRDIRNHKGHRTEADFSHLHDRFVDPEDSA